MSARSPHQPGRAPRPAGSPAAKAAGRVVPSRRRAATFPHTTVAHVGGTIRETSAGGIAVREFDGRPCAAIIGRLSMRGQLRWSLPKGHLEPGETLEQAAVREVAEETGITATIVQPLGSFAYTFMQDGQRIRKRVHHFLMTAQSGELSDADVEVAEVAWVALDDLPRVLDYAAERHLAKRAASLIAEAE